MTSRLHRWAARLADSGATSAVEFAMIAPLFIALTVGLFNAALLAYSAVNLHSAVETAARCASVSTTVCANAATIKSAASAAYYGPDIGASFSTSTGACGNIVKGSGSFVLFAGIATFTVPLSATACFP